MKKIVLFLYLLCLNSLFTVGQTNIKISHQPYIQGLTENSVIVLWTTDKPAVSWVELAPDDDTHFYHKERPKYFATVHGFKKVSTLHQVTLSGLKAGTKYRYRVYSQEVLKHQGTKIQYGNIVATDVYQKKPLTFETPSVKNNGSFLVINDIHGRNEVLNKMLDVGDVKSSDFVIFNGDMANSLNSEEQMFADFMDTAISRFASEKPMYYSRGNHETRGPFAIEYPNYFPTPTGKLYYQFNHGDMGIIVLDCGEDKPDSDMEYSGIVQMDDYRTEQAKWLEHAINDPSFKNAKYKVVICHMPPFEGWYGEQDILDKFVPILNKANVQVMLSAHLHKHIIRPSNDKVKFPVLVNSNNNLIKVEMNDNGVKFKVLDQKGVLVDELLLKPLHY